MLTFSAIAMADTKEKERTVTQPKSYLQQVEETNGDTKNDTIKAKKTETSVASQIGGDGSRFDISVLIADFINRNNIKIVKRILKD